MFRRRYSALAPELTGDARAKGVLTCKLSVVQLKVTGRAQQAGFGELRRRERLQTMLQRRPSLCPAAPPGTWLSASTLAPHILPLRLELSRTAPNTRTFSRCPDSDPGQSTRRSHPQHRQLCARSAACVVPEAPRPRCGPGRCTLCWLGLPPVALKAWHVVLTPREGLQALEHKLAAAWHPDCSVPRLPVPVHVHLHRSLPSHRLP